MKPRAGLSQMGALMNTPRRAFNPEVVRPLEARVVFSAVAPVLSVAVEQAIENGPPMHPVLIVTGGGSSQAKVISVGRSDQHGQLAFSAHDVNLTVPIDASIPVTVKTNDQRGKEIELIYHNESNDNRRLRDDRGQARPRHDLHPR